MDTCGFVTLLILVAALQSSLQEGYKPELSRSYLANGTQTGKNGTTFPPAKDMKLLQYDCQLEAKALTIAKTCTNVTDYDFDHVGNNSILLTGGQFTLWNLFPTVMTWWNTLFTSDLKDLTPTDMNRGMIPFLQMAFANTTKIGCALHTCSDNSVSFACKYGNRTVQRDKPIYTSGRPCGTCPTECVFGSLCNTTESI
ncbi:SCP-like protein [Dictyocaulus viviparus]|uniref:SCP-like protein n=1 Tax=Dictyocaulus viviparus TaxID=29172 RepID=A0A0D8YAZ1_DICVI|nr:SCP-like protein [Dictyocaulus viviparus]